ncbi:MAG: nitrous oxide-stimulated promoter family protein [Clostridium sp.]|nr:nitrous oxide-stimulated promoter family protein [Clostridium sp.]
MIEINCKHKHLYNGSLCQECEKIKNYANMKIDKCPHMESKTFCSQCKTHCYDKLHRDKIREIMKYSGPRIIIFHPVATVKHIISSKLH